jgi:hypothetical protein
MLWGDKASTSFSGEKEAKRLLLIWAMGVATFRLKRSKSFFAPPAGCVAVFFKKSATTSHIGLLGSSCAFCI